MSIPTSCPLCNASHAEQSVVTHHIFGGSVDQAFYKCQSCDVIYLYPGLDAEQEAKFYAAEFAGE
jgi:transposase-like protein